MNSIKYFNKELINTFSDFVLGLDVGGTNTNISVAGVKERKPEILISFNYKSREQNSIISSINQTLSFAKKNYNLDIKNACIAAAGVVSSSQDLVKLTNTNLQISTKEIIENTSLQSAFIINDFEAVGYAINLINHNDKNDIHIIKEIKEIKNKKPKAVIGAGTGLGKCILNYNNELNCYIPSPSEGGHGDFPAYNENEIEIANYIKKTRTSHEPLTYEELLSGRGIENIYKFVKFKNKFNETNFTKEIDESTEKASLISKYKEVDEACSETFKIFTRFYARCAKNFVLDSLATGGLYIAGGIASKNISIFTSEEFLNEFTNSYRRSDVLESVPIYVVKNYDVSLYGACFAAIIKKLGEKK
jgi:glucokinase